MGVCGRGLIEKQSTAVLWGLMNWIRRVPSMVVWMDGLIESKHSTLLLAVALIDIAKSAVPHDGPRLTNSTAD